MNTYQEAYALVASLYASGDLSHDQANPILAALEAAGELEEAALAEVVMVDNLHCLMVAGIVLAMETDICRDQPDGSMHWTRQMLCDAAQHINELQAGLREEGGMTPEDADRLYEQVQRLTLAQLFALWSWIYMEIGGRLAKEGW